MIAVPYNFKPSRRNITPFDVDDGSLGTASYKVQGLYGVDFKRELFMPWIAKTGRPRYFPEWALLWLNRQIRAEALTFLFGNHMMSIKGNDGTLAFLLDMDPVARKSVKSLQLALHIMEGGINPKWLESLHFIATQMTGVTDLRISIKDWRGRYGRPGEPQKGEDLAQLHTVRDHIRRLKTFSLDIIVI